MSSHTDRISDIRRAGNRAALGLIEKAFHEKFPAAIPTVIPSRTDTVFLVGGVISERNLSSAVTVSFSSLVRTRPTDGSKGIDLVTMRFARPVWTPYGKLFEKLGFSGTEPNGYMPDCNYEGATVAQGRYGHIGRPAGRNPEHEEAQTGYFTMAVRLDDLLKGLDIAPETFAKAVRTAQHEKADALHLRLVRNDPQEVEMAPLYQRGLDWISNAAARFAARIVKRPAASRAAPEKRHTPD